MIITYLRLSRFHMTVSETLGAHQPEVIELEQPMTKAMLQLQESIVQVMDACLQELKKTNQVSIFSSRIPQTYLSN